jgi:sporadic carbohydrate cluster 2OG-Fe(II) oxygenase
MGPIEDFERNGFAVVPSDSLETLQELRRSVYAIAKRNFTVSETDPARGLNLLHEAAATGAELNERRLRLIREVNETANCAEHVFHAFESSLHQLLGPDILAQRTTNLVIQQPGDPNPSELHRDAPANSPYEVVVWVPLVDCYGSKSMYLLPREATSAALARLSERPDDWEGFHAFCLSLACGVDVPFGKALLFWSGLLHGSHVNRESETRFSLNVRYKSLFAPSGLKEPFEFFRILRTSPLTRLGLAFQREQALR